MCMLKSTKQTAFSGLDMETKMYGFTANEDNVAQNLELRGSSCLTAEALQLLYTY